MELNIQWMYAAAPPWTGAQCASIVGCLWSIDTDCWSIVEVDSKDWQRNVLEVFVFFFPPDVDDAVSQGKSGPKWRFARVFTLEKININSATAQA